MKSHLIERLLGHRTAVLTALAMGAAISSAQAAPITVVNGSFEQTLVSGVSSQFGDLFPAQQVTGWTTNGYNFVFTSGAADTTYASGQYGPNNVGLWGPNAGSANGLPASSPDGGNFLALDGAYEQSAVQQVISGLTTNSSVTVSFWFAGAQQLGFNGLNTEQLNVSLGAQSINTVVLNNTSHGFTGWQHETLTFTPTGSSEVLSFLAIGTPNGSPPFSLLDGVSISSVVPTPEPSSLVLMFTGLAGVGSLVRARFKKG